MANKLTVYKSSEWLEENNMADVHVSHHASPTPKLADIRKSVEFSEHVYSMEFEADSFKSDETFSSENNDTDNKNDKLLSSCYTESKQDKNDNRSTLSLEYEYSEDFEDSDLPSEHQKHKETVGNSNEDELYSADFESETDVGKSTENIATDIQDDVSASIGSSAQYSDTFESSSRVTSRRTRSLSESSSLSSSLRSSLLHRSSLQLTRSLSVEVPSWRQHSYTETERSSRLSLDARSWSRHTYSYSESFESDTEPADESSTFSGSQSSVESVIPSARQTKEEDTRKGFSQIEQEEIATFIKKKLQALQKPKSEIHHAQEKPRKLDKATRRFCQKKLRLLKDNQSAPTVKEAEASIHGNKDGAQHPLQERKKLQQPVQFYGIPTSKVEKLRIRNIMQSMQQAARQDIHEPRRCRNCRHKAMEIQREHFVKVMKARAMEKLVQARLEEAFYTRGTSHTLGQLVQALPDPQLTNEEIFSRMHSKACGDGPMISSEKNRDVHQEVVTTRANSTVPMATTKTDAAEQASLVHAITNKSHLQVLRKENGPRTKARSSSRPQDVHANQTDYIHMQEEPSSEDFWKYYFEPLRHLAGRDAGCNCGSTVAQGNLGGSCCWLHNR